MGWIFGIVIGAILGFLISFLVFSTICENKKTYDLRKAYLKGLNEGFEQGLKKHV